MGAGGVAATLPTHSCTDPYYAFLHPHYAFSGTYLRILGRSIAVRHRQQASRDERHFQRLQRASRSPGTTRAAFPDRGGSTLPANAVFLLDRAG